MEDIEYIEETRPQPKITLLTFAEYYELNCLLSTLEGYDLTKATQRCLEMNPRAAKTDIVYNEESEDNEIISYTPKLVAKITSNHQINYPLIFAEYDLIDSYIPTGEEIYEFIVNVISLNVVNWTAMQFSAVKGIGKDLTLIVSQELIDSLTDEMRVGLVQLGLTLKTAELED